MVSNLDQLIRQNVAQLVQTNPAVAGSLWAVPSPFLARWAPSFNIYRSGTTYLTDWTPVSSGTRPTGTVNYFSKTGNDTTGDGSSGNPYRTLQKGLSVGTNVYMIRSGFWDQADVFTAASYTPNGVNVAFVAADGPGTVTLSRAYNGLGWAQESSPNTDVYLTTAATFEMAVDLAAPGQPGRYLADGATLVPVPLTSVASIAACQALPGSYFYTGTSLYVHTFNNRAPDASVKVLPTEGWMWFTFGSNQVFGYEGCNLFGRRFGRTEHAAANNNTFYMYQCYNGFSVESSMSPVRVQGTKNNYIKQCSFSNFTQADACSLSMGNTATQVAPPNGLFENIKVWDCGSTGGTNINAFTGHYASNAIILSCSADRCYGPLYAFVLGANAIILGSYGSASLASAASAAQQSIFQSGQNNDIDNLTPSVIWMENDSAAGDNYGRAGVLGTGLYRGVIYNMGGYTDTTTKGDYTGTVITPWP